MTNRAEDTLLLHSVRRFLGSEDGETTSLLVSGVGDWPYLLRLADRHGVTPLLCQCLYEEGWNTVPEPYARELRQRSRGLARRSLSLTSELVEVLSLFERKSIQALAFKGPALASLLYGDVAFRIYDDIDVLVRKDDLREAKAVLLAQGYRTDLPLDPAQEAAYLRARYELHFTPADRALSIEIHQAFLAPFNSIAFDYDSLWHRLERKAFCGREILALRPDDLLLVLCAHGAKHCWARLGWICDVARLLVVFGNELDWQELTRRALSLGTTRILLLGLFLAEHLLGAPVPQEVLESAEQDPSIARLARTVEESLFGQGNAAGELQSHLFFLRARERFRDKIRYCAGLTLTPNEEDHSVVALPPLLSPLYYPLHGVRLLGKYGLTTLRGCLR